ncbi:MAG: hypothetical protein ACRC3B_02595, partial [Bacteroidia bacterium]
MKKRLLFLPFILVLLISAINFHSPELKKTKVLILGTAHLNSIEGIKEEHIALLLDTLSSFEFDAIGIEQMPAELLFDIKSRSSESWQELYSYYSSAINQGTRFQEQYKINYSAAVKLRDSLLAKQVFNEKDRMQLIKSFLCSYDIWSASIHYQYIKDKSQLDTALVNLMKKYNNSTNEINLIGVNLAKRLNIKELEYIDNMQDETILGMNYPEFF